MEHPKRKLWFRRKTYGWGWTPVTWQGWAVTAAHVVLIVALAMTIDENSPPNEAAFLFFLPLLLLGASLFTIAWKTGEGPKWQWGGGTKK